LSFEDGDLVAKMLNGIFEFADTILLRTDYGK
jgi:hypothetical protein